MKTLLFAFAGLSVWCSQAAAQGTVNYSSTQPGGGGVEVIATLSAPKKPPPAGQKSAAVILLHSKGGWDYPVTEQYAKALSEAGFLVLEPRLFARRSAPPGPLPLLPMVYDALRYLAARGDVDSQRIGVAGYSLGGMLALHSAASWAQAAYAKSPDLKFAAHAPFYPVCWVFSDLAQGKRQPPGFPNDAFSKWTGAPVKIFAAGRDDYDDKDPKACAEFVSYVPAAHQGAFSVQLYPDATHGWDQQSARFHEHLACKGRGCMNSNEANSKVTQQSIDALVEFFGKALAKDK